MEEVLDHFNLKVEEVLVNNDSASGDDILSSFENPVHIFIDLSCLSSCKV